MEPWVFIAGAIPYFFLFHIGFIAFFYFAVLSVYKPKYRKPFVQISWVKILTCVYSVGVGLLMPFSEVHFNYPGLDTPLFFTDADLPALLTTLIIQSPFDPTMHHLHYYLIYGGFGLIGGWGLGLAIDQIIQKRKGIILSS